MDQDGRDQVCTYAHIYNTTGSLVWRSEDVSNCCGKSGRVNCSEGAICGLLIGREEREMSNTGYVGYSFLEGCIIWCARVGVRSLPAAITLEDVRRCRLSSPRSGNVAVG